jgi:hypothetical protein
VLLAFANLESHGIVARPAMPAPAQHARDLLGAELAANRPHGLICYVFWTERDDAVFESDGSLKPDCELTLHHSGGFVARATRAALIDFDITSADRSDETGPTLVIRADDAAR